MTWTNKKRIKIARGRNKGILESTATQAEGQLVYDEDTHYLTVGTLDSSGKEKTIKNNVPIRARTVEGWCEDEETFGSGKYDTYRPRNYAVARVGYYRLYGIKEDDGTNNVYLSAGDFSQASQATATWGPNLNLISKGDVSVTCGAEQTINISNGDIGTSSSAQIKENSIAFAVNGTRMLTMQKDTTANTNKIVVDGFVPVELYDGSTLNIQRTNMVGNYSDIYTTQLSAFDTTGTGLTFKRSGTRWGSKTYDVSLYSDANIGDGKAYLYTTNSPTDSSNDNTLATTAFVHNLMGFKSHSIINAFNGTVVGKIYRQGKLLFGHINQPLAYSGTGPINNAQVDTDGGVWLWKTDTVSWKLLPDSSSEDPTSLFIEDGKNSIRIFQTYTGAPGYQVGARVQTALAGSYIYSTVDGLLNVAYNLATGEFTPYLTGHPQPVRSWQSLDIRFYINLDE